MLVYHAYFQRESVLRRTDHNFLSAYENFAFVWKINAADHIHQRRFTAAVFAEKRKYLAAVQFEVDVFVRHDLSESFRNVFQFKRNSLFQDFLRKYCV